MVRTEHVKHIKYTSEAQKGILGYEKPAKPDEM